MRERPILFSAPMVRAILSGQKTQTRRVVKLPGDADWYDHLGCELEGFFFEYERLVARRVDELPCPYGQPGDRLWVRETLRERDHSWVYDADGAPVQLAEDDPRVPQMISWAHHKESDVCVSIHMPRWASRITLEITETRAERLHQITEADALREGTREPSLVPIIGGAAVCERDVFGRLWIAINGRESWGANPWVWVVSFRRLEGSP